MKIKVQIITALTEKGDLSVKEIVDILDVSKQGVHVALKQLLDENLISKFGRTPKTIYRLFIQKESFKSDFNNISQKKQSFLSDNFLLISEIGHMMDGLEGFERWCRSRKLPLEKTIEEFMITKKKYEEYYDLNGIINGKEKLLNTKGYDKIFLDEVFYLDFYAIERFGKTKLGTLLHYAKQGQNKFLMKILLKEMKPKLDILLKTNNFDAVGFVPPTIRREVQLMKYLETHLKIDLPKIIIKKISGIIPVPQKSLSKLEERISNAENTFAISETVKYKHILLIDDAIGSGSTLNQIAGKIKQKGIAAKISGLAIVGSFKGFDVVTDV
jgi:DNA-binding transcriptional regulator GbsR (MarR family)